MKLMRHGPKGAEKPALVDADGRVRDLSAALPDISAATLAPERLARLRDLDTSTLPISKRRAVSRRRGRGWASSSASA